MLANQSQAGRRLVRLPTTLANSMPSPLIGVVMSESKVSRSRSLVMQVAARTPSIRIVKHPTDVPAIRNQIFMP